MCKKNENNTSNNKYQDWKEVIAIAIVAVLLGAFYTLIFTNRIDCSGDGSIIGFFGILATFVVIGNYAQVTNIKNQVDKDIMDIRNHVDDEITKITNEKDDYSIISKVNRLYQGNSPKYEVDIPKIVSENFERQKKEYNLTLKYIFDVLLKNQHGEFLSDILSGKEVKCKVKSHIDDNEKTARAKLEGSKIIFIDSLHQVPIESVIKVNGKVYDANTYNKIVEWWKSMNYGMISVEAINEIYGINANS